MSDEDPPFDPAEVTRLLFVLEALAADRGLLAALSAEERRRLIEATGKLRNPTFDEKRRLRKAFRRRDLGERRAHDDRLLAATAIRNLPSSPRFLVAQLGGRVLPTPDAVADAADEAELKEPRACYICKRDYSRLHPFYDSLCPRCAELNYAKRTQSAPLDGRVALVTGARLKIGYQTALLLLRAGARVLATTRFPHDAAERFSREPDFSAWRGRLSVHGLDLRHIPSVERFARHLEEVLPRLDVLINNAAQTVRRPPGFYRHLLDVEERPAEALSEAAQQILGAHEALRRQLAGERVAPWSDPESTLALGPMTTASSGPGPGPGPGLMAWQGGSRAIGLTDSARLSQLGCAPGDEAGPEAFPPGLVDGDLQQVDVRPLNSWRMTADLVSTAELLEVHLVNAVAPFVLVARLRRLMQRERTGEKHIINVSAMEAQFSRNKKTDKHPHTNMAKASLNMLTRTSAQDYAKDGIFMNSVDTGWVTDEDPVQHVAHKQDIHDFHPPLDSLDGAARVLDPLFTGLQTGHHSYGHFFKDYTSVAW